MSVVLRWITLILSCWNVGVSAKLIYLYAGAVVDSDRRDERKVLVAAVLVNITFGIIAAFSLVYRGIDIAQGNEVSRYDYAALVTQVLIALTEYTTIRTERLWRPSGEGKDEDVK